MNFIGDIHGKYSTYKKLIRSLKESVVVGDMGVGFFKPCSMTGEPRAQPNPPFDAMARGWHRFIRGNHDNPNVCKRHRFWIPDGTYEADTGTMYVGGARSIDRASRLPDYDWWADEELSYDGLSNIVDQYSEVKPRIMVTHDCPQTIAEQLLIHSDHAQYSSVTRQAFQVMFEIHQPEIWVFGHHHVHVDMLANGTRFVCLAELQVMEL